MRYIVRHVDTMPERVECVSEMQKQIPDLIVVRDVKHQAMDTLLRALEAAGDDSCIHIEDDLELCNEFVERSSRFIAMTPYIPIVFYSASVKRTELRPASSFYTTTCFYLPEGMSADVLDFYHNRWDETVKGKDDPDWTDLLLSRYLVSIHQPYLQLSPGIVQHKLGKSAISPYHNSKRQTQYFYKGDDSE